MYPISKNVSHTDADRSCRTLSGRVVRKFGSDDLPDEANSSGEDLNQIKCLF